MKIVIKDNALQESLKQYMERDNCYLRTYYVLKRPIDTDTLTTITKKTNHLLYSLQDKIIKAYIRSKGIEKKVQIPYCQYYDYNKNKQIELALGTPILIPALRFKNRTTFGNSGYTYENDPYQYIVSANFIALCQEDKQISPEEIKEQIEELEVNKTYREYINFLVNHLKDYKDINGLSIEPEKLSHSELIKIKEWNIGDVIESSHIEETLTEENKIQEPKPSPTLDLILEIRSLLSTYSQETRKSYETRLQEILQTTKENSLASDFELRTKLCNLLADIQYIDQPKLKDHEEYIDKYLTDILTSIQSTDNLDDLESHLETFYQLVNKIQNQEEVPNLAEYDTLHQKATTILSTLLIKFPEHQEQILTTLSADFEQSIRFQMQNHLETELSSGGNALEIYPLLTEGIEDNKEYIKKASKILQKNNMSKKQQ